MNRQELRPFAVVTGASSGIGFELAEVFAEEDFDLPITAEDEEIEAAQRELNFSVKTEMHRKMAQPATAGERGER